MSETLLVLIGGALGWILKGLFGPSVDHFGNSIKEYFQNRNKDDYHAYKLYQKLESLITKLHSTVGHNRFYETSPYLSESEITELLLSTDKKLQRKALKQWIEYGKVYSFAQSDIFFAGLYLLKEFLSADDVKLVYEKHRKNNQANLWPFLEKIENYKPTLLDSDVVHYLRLQQEEWNKK